MTGTKRRLTSFLTHFNNTKCVCLCFSNQRIGNSSDPNVEITHAIGKSTTNDKEKANLTSYTIIKV